MTVPKTVPKAAPMLVPHRCPDCRRALSRGEERMTCSGCGACWPVADGVPVYATAGYFGELPRAEMEKLVRAAEEGHWLTAASAWFKESNPGMYRYVADLTRASWTPLLPIGPASTVLDVGSGLGCLTHALALAYERVVSIEPVDERVRFTKARLAQEGLTNVELIQTTLTRLPFWGETFDLIVLNGILEWIGAWRLDADPRRAQLETLARLRGLLKPGGLVLIGIENRIGYTSFLGRLDHPGVRFTNLLPRWAASLYLRLRRPGFYRTLPEAGRGYRTYTYSPRGYAKLLRQAGFESPDLWWPRDGYNLPNALYRATARREIAAYFRRTRHFQDRVTGPALRRRLQEWLLVRSGLIYAMFPDLVLIAGRGGTPVEGGPGSRSLLAAVEEALARRGATPSECRPAALWSHGLRNKLVIKLADPSGRLSTVVKVSNLRLPGADGIERGQRVLQHLAAAFERGDPCLRGTVPSPVACLRVGPLVAGVESPAPGRYFLDECIERGYFADRPRVREDLARLAAWLAAAHPALQQLGTHVPLPGVPPSWREDGAGGPDRAQADSADSWVQHGDLFPGNVFWDARGGRLSVIDWDDCGPGYPPLFDWFCLLLGMYYTHEGVPRVPKGQTVDGRSFRESFFEPGWFADTILSLTEDLCDRLGVEGRRVLAHFEDCLLLRQHQFLQGRAAEAPGRWASQYREFRAFALQHEEECIFRRLGRPRARRAAPSGRRESC